MNMRNRNIKKQIWLNHEEDKTLKHKAEKVGMSEATLIRNLINGFEPREKPDDRFYGAMKLFHSISNNLNQIARKANTLGFIDAPHYQKEVEKLNTLMIDIKRKFLSANTND